MVSTLALKNTVKQSHSPDETREIARQFAIGLKAGDIILLSGDLGAGKTLFVKGICDVFQCAEFVSSPTFTIVNSYQGKNLGAEYAIHHFDLYRISREEELSNIGFDEYLYSPAISIIEWSDRFPHLFPDHSRRVTLEKSGENARLIRIV